MKNFNSILSILLMLMIHAVASAQPTLTGKIVYHSYSDYNAWDSQLFVLDLATGTRTAISAGWNIDHEMNAHWSPDGTKLVFMGDVAGEPRNWDIFIWTVGSSQPVNLTNGASREEDPKFSPDGQRIVFKKDNDLWQMDLNGNIINNITNTATVEESMPFYTADGNAILFAPGVGAGSDIYRINTNGTSRQAMVAVSNVQEYFPIARDNASFFYTSWQNSSDFHDQIYLKYYANSSGTRLPFNSSTSNYSDAYPVGSQYVLTSSDRPGGKGNYDLYIADINTGQIWSLDSYNSNVNSSLQDLGAAYNNSGSNTSQSPYGGTALVLPGKVEAENYDNGGEGVAYHDVTSGNSGSGYRTDNVDIEGTSDTGGGYNVGYIATGEWLEYTVNVSTAGTYSLQVRAAAASAGGNIHVEFDGVNASGVVVIPNTGGWQTWQTVTINTTALTTGQKVMRIYIDAGGFNLNYLNFSVNTSNNQTPYGGTAWVLPGKVEAENYDNGGEGVAYHDNTLGNSGAVYRNDGVDIEATTDAGGGYNIGYITTGEWLEYTVSVNTAGTYSLQVRVAAASSGGIIHVEMNGINVSGTITIPNTGGWQTWQTVTLNTTALTTGQKVMRIYIDAGGFNLNYVNFSVSTSNNQTPYGGTAWIIPGKIEAENYDNGGEGVAYHDLSAGNSGNVYRTNDVDLESCSDAGAGYDVGGIGNGEWLEYTINVASSSTYTVAVRVATAASGGHIRVEVDGVNVGQINVPNTGGWQTWQTASVVTSTISSGQKVLRLFFDIGNFNINYVNFSAGAGRLSAADVNTFSDGKLQVASYPNPVRDHATIIANINTPGHALISFHDFSGKKISTIHDGFLQAGTHEFLFDAQHLQSGLYFLQISNKGHRSIKKVVKID
jgi:Tol biopolymer transport system component